MAILIANIGTSDLAVQLPINGENYFLPIDFLTEEPNLKKQIDKLEPKSREVWNNQRKYIEGGGLYQELGFDVGVKPTSLKLTEALLKHYKENPLYWHPRLKPVRIWGAIQKSVSFGVNRAYIFVTDQRREKEIPDGHEKDTIYLYNILEIWLQREGLEFSLSPEVIRIQANDQDALLGYYYQKLNEISITELARGEKLEEELVLTSFKGGTPQMKTALQIQAMASAFENQILLEPEIAIERILQGKPSDCHIRSYWRYVRCQKYQTVKQLLERWDFDGAIQILNQWQSTLKALSQKGIKNENMADNQQLIDSALKVLEVALSYFNLDISGTIKPIKVSEALGWVKKIQQNYDQVLNLYTQCRIFWRLNEVANFLSRLGSFCEETLHQIIIKLDGKQYFDKKNYPNQWYLDSRKIPKELWSYFYELESETNNSFKTWDFTWKPKYSLPGRFSKRNFVSALIKYRGEVREITLWQEILESLEKLDYWLEKRNELIHSAKGVSKESMSKVLERDRKNLDDARLGEKALAACARDLILSEMTKISRNTSKLLNLGENVYLGEEAKYYIYSEVGDWVVNKLMTDGLR